MNLDELFHEHAPRIDDNLIDFDQALQRASMDALDAEAFSAMTSHFEAAKAGGNLNAVYSMAMNIGAMACLHEHLQDYANEVSSSFMHDTEAYGHHDHESQDHEPESDKKGKKSKKKKAVSWFSWLFDER